MKKIVNYVLVGVVAFGLGHNFAMSHWKIVEAWESNSFKTTYIRYLDEASMLVDSIIDSHADDGTCDDLVQELYDAGYYELMEKVDNMAKTQL